MARVIKASKVNARPIDADDAYYLAVARGQDLAQMRVTPTVADEPRSQGETVTKKTK